MKPAWLKINLPKADEFFHVKKILQKYNLKTVCESALCPNITECFTKKTATFMIMGDVCTRNCRYCGVKKGKPLPLDTKEPENIRKAADELQLKHVVITSVTRDDLPDQGAGHFYRTIKGLKQTTEALVPDLKDNNLKRVLEARPYVLNHNIETTKRIFPGLRPEGDYQASLDLLKSVKRFRTEIILKSGFMIGIGEDKDEIKETILDLKKCGVDVITIGQYLQPTIEHAPVSRYYTPEEFEELQTYGREQGIYILAGPLVRSSYRAAQIVKHLRNF